MMYSGALMTLDSSEAAVGGPAWMLRKPTRSTESRRSFRVLRSATSKCCFRTACSPSGEKKLESENRNRTYSERFYGRFERQITLDRDVDDSAVNATFKNGVLTVTVPKSPRAVERSKRIPINAGKTEVKSH
jgi:Hsp20/alpha crystallin family